MNKNYFKGSMRSLREFTAETNSNKASHDRALAKAGSLSKINNQKII